MTSFLRSWQKTSYTYNNRNFLSTITQYETDGSIDNVTRYAYDGKGNILSTTAGLSSEFANDGKTTYYTYDRFDNVLSVTDAAGQTETHSYSAWGRLMSKTDRNGNTTTYRLDALGREFLVMVSDPEDATIVTQTRYAPGGEPASKTEMGSAGGPKLQMYSYDETGRLASAENRIGTNYRDYAAYTYTLGGQRASFALGKRSGNSASLADALYTYTNRGLLLAVSEGSSSNVKAEYTYTPGGRVETETVHSGGNVNKTEYRYNGIGLATNEYHTLNGGRALHNTYSFNANGSMNGAVTTNKEATEIITKTYTYDGAGRLESEAQKEGDVPHYTANYTYDHNGNRATAVVVEVKKGTEKVSDYKYDNTNQLEVEAWTQGNKTTTVTYGYDANGNQTSKTTTTTKPNKSETETFAYNAKNQLEKVTAGKLTTSYVYLPNELRHSKTTTQNSKSVTTIHSWDITDIVADITSQDGTTEKISTYLRGVGLVSSVIDGTAYYYQTNAHGDVAQFLNSTGTPVHTYKYNAFGLELNASDIAGSGSTSQATDANPFRYCGEYYDLETGTIYLRARSYVPGTGRFTQRDSVLSVGSKRANGQNIVNPLSLNLYTYCYNKPLAHTDPSGYDPTFYCHTSKHGGKTWRFLGDSKGTNVAVSLFGFVPFLDTLIWKTTDFFSKNKTITQNVRQDIATTIGSSLGIADLASSKLGSLNAAKNFSKVAGKASNLITIINISVEAYDDSPYYNEITGKVFRGYFESRTFDLTAARFLAYSEITKDMVDKGIITYEASWGVFKDHHVDWDRFYQYFDDLGIEPAGVGQLINDDYRIHTNRVLERMK